MECDESLRSLLQEHVKLIQKKLEYCASVDEFAREVSNLIERLEFDRPDVSTHSLTLSFAYYDALLRDLEEFGWSRVSSVSDSLQRFTLTIQDPSRRSHEVMVTLPATYPQGTPSCQLALPESFPFHWTSSNSIRDIVSAVSEALAKYDSVWSVLEDFDKHCVVIDPMKPTFQHNYRRVYLGVF